MDHFFFYFIKRRDVPQERREKKVGKSAVQSWRPRAGSAMKSGHAALTFQNF
jgi:hypothetical protein